MIAVMGYIRLNASNVGEFVSYLIADAPRIRELDGCLFYAVAADPDSAERVLVAERWQSEDALRAHLQLQQASTFAQKWMSKLSIEVQKYDISNERSLLD